MSEQVKERPLLMSRPMVRATLREIDPKTQTRRAFRLQPPEDDGRIMCGHYHPTVVDRHGNEQPGPEVFGCYSEYGQWSARCPYGKPGDLLRVRETFFAYGRWETRFSEKKGRDEWHFIDMTFECDLTYRYAADSDELPHMLSRKRAGVTPMWHKRPAIFMPRAASRILLEIENVRVERLLNISEADAIAEGIEGCDVVINGRSQGKTWRDYSLKCDDPCEWLSSPIDSYRSLWESINGPGSWALNPWVRAITFKRIAP